MQYIEKIKNERLEFNYFTFVNWWLVNGENKTDYKTIVKEMLEHREWAKDRYLLDCWDKKHFNKLNKAKDIDKYITSFNRWELKRGLGLALEHWLVSSYKTLIPAPKEKMIGKEAYDFEFKGFLPNGEYKNIKIDLKLHLGRLGAYQRNKSKYNIDIVLSDEELERLFMALSSEMFLLLGITEIIKLVRTIYNGILESIIKMQNRKKALVSANY